jgi:hypothetical protein
MLTIGIFFVFHASAGIDYNNYQINIGEHKLCVVMITLVLAEVALSVSPMPQRGSKVLMLKSLNSQNSHKGKC